MGNSTSAAIDIVLEPEASGHAVFTAGTNLKGEVFIKVKRKMEGAPVMLCLTGKEKVAIRSRDVEVATRAERPLIKVDLPLRSFHKDNKIKPGLYTFPFSIPLPDSLPASDKFPFETSKPEYQIQYRLVASVGRLEKSRAFRVLSAPLPVEPVPVMVKPTFHKISSMKLFDAGRVALGASLANSNVGRGEEIQLFLACRNDSTAEIRSISVRLMENLEWTTVGRKADRREASKALVTVKNIVVPINHMMKKPRSEVKRRKFDASLQDDTYLELFDELAAKHNPVRIKIPETARDSYEGKLVHVSHQIEIGIQTTSMSSNATTLIPLQVGTPSAEDTGQAPDLVPEPSNPSTVPQSPYPEPINPSTVPQSPCPTLPPPTVPLEERTSAESSSSSIPFAAAVPIDEPVRFSLVTAPEEAIVLGGAAVLDANESGSSPVTASAPPEFSDDVTVNALIAQMETSVNDFELISNHLIDAQWVSLFGSIEPDEYGQIIAHVKNHCDQPRVASTLAAYVLGGTHFTCAYAAAAIRNTSEAYRSTVAQRLIPLCIDIAQNSNLIHSELNAWDQTVTARDFEDAILAATAD